MWLLGQDSLMLDCGRAYADVVLCELVVEVVYTDLASVAMKGSAMFWRSRSLCIILLVGCAPGWRSSVVQIVIVVATTATACAVFFVAIVNPVAGSKSAVVQCTTISNNLTRQCRISRRVCSISPEVGVSSCSRGYPSFESAAAGRYRRLEWHGVMRRSWRMSRANVDRTVQGGGSCGT